MSLLYVKGENFRTLRKFYFDMQDRGVVVLRGPNGAGKSSLVEAIGWCFFGQVARGGKGGKVAFRHTKEPCFVEVALESGNADEVWRIRRTTAKSGALTVALVNPQGAHDITRQTMAETQSMVESMLGMDWQTYLAVYYFGARAVKAWSEMTDKEVKSAFDAVLPMEEWREKYERARGIHREFSDLLQAKRDKLNRTESALLANITRLKEVGVMAREFEGERNTTLSDLKMSLTDLRDSRKKVMGKLSKTKQDESGPTLSGLPSVPVLERNLNQARGELAALKKMRERKCPKCGYNLDGEARVQERREVEERIAQLQEDLAQSTKHRNRLETEALTEELRGVERQIEYTMGMFKRESGRSNPHRGILEQLREDITDSKRLSAKLKAKVEALNEEVAALWYLVKAYGPAGIPSHMMATITPPLNEAAAYYGGILCGGQARIEFSTVSRLKTGEIREKFQIITSMEDGGGGYADLSEGERKRINLACSLAFRRLMSLRANRSLGFLVVDEAFDNVDVVGRERAVECIKAERERTIIVITHSAELAGHFENQIKVSKHGKITSFDPPQRG